MKENTKAERATEPRFFTPWSEPQVRRGNLPHWDLAGATYFVTWRLADSIPKEKIERLQEEREQWLSHRDQPLCESDEQEFHKRFSGKIDEWMDAGSGSCVLRDGNVRSKVEESVRHFDGERYVQHSFVIMPNHVHLLFSLAEKVALADLLHSWKSFSANRINKLLKKVGQVLWQKEYFDRLIRDWKHFGNCVRYIRNNPVKVNLRDSDYTLYESELAKSIQ